MEWYAGRDRPIHPEERHVKIRNRWLNKLGIIVAVAVVRVLYWTCRLEVHGDVTGANPYKLTGDRRFLYCIWHDQLMMTVFSGRPKKMAGLVSRHQDGSYLSDALKIVGITPVRGSTSRGGAQALRQLLDATQDLHVAITPDGPRGPRHELKNGIVYLASQTGRKIVATAYDCARCWKIQGSWTDMMIPKPFTRIVVVGSEPMEIPPNLSREGLEVQKARLQLEMQRLADEAARLLGREPEESQPVFRKAA